MKIFDGGNNKDNRKNRRYNRDEQFKYVAGISSVDGMVLEFGVYKADSLNTIASLFPKQTVYGFDNFEGLPEVWHFGDRKHEIGHYDVDEMPEVRDNVVLVKGLFEDTLEPWLDEHDGNVSFIHLDCDLYSSTKYVLEVLNSRIVPGTLIIFDEYKDWGGDANYTNWAEHEYKACQEWLSENDREIKMVSRTSYVQTSFIVEK